jgi:hypothetical protein
MFKRYRNRGGTVLNCFSPPVMIATFAIEIALAVYTVWRYRLDVFGRLIVALLVFLATFQLAEYFVCGGMGVSAMNWSRVGYAAITTLPPLGLHLLHVIAKKPQRKLVYTAYASAAMCIAYFLSYDAAFAGYQCTGNYVIFQLGRWPAVAYGAYYYGWLVAALALARRWADQIKSTVKDLAPRRQAVLAMAVGYLVFLVPTALANSVAPGTRRGIPSIMCGFAVLFALILAFYIAPRIGRLRTPNQS